MFSTISARQIQREYKRVLENANKSKEPIIVMSNNKPQGAVIGLDLLEKLQLEAVLEEALIEHKLGKTKTISTKKELENDFEEMRREAGLLEA
jgi:prevent-host-death family protein